MLRAAKLAWQADLNFERVSSLADGLHEEGKEGVRTTGSTPFLRAALRQVTQEHIATTRRRPFLNVRQPSGCRSVPGVEALRDPCGE